MAYLSHKLGTNVLYWVLKLNFLGDCNTIIDNARTAVLGLQNNIAPLCNIAYA